MIFKIEEFIASRKKYNWRSGVMCAVRRKQLYDGGYVDHEGNSFESITQMAGYWGTTGQRLKMRLSRGYTLEEALTMPRYTRRRPRKKEK